MPASYTRFVERMFKSAPVTIAETSEYVEGFGKLHAAVGLADEAAEVLGAIKKSVFTGKPYDRAKLVDEMGDVEFYMEALRQQLDITRDEIVDFNRDKLETRHGDNNIEKHYE